MRQAGEGKQLNTPAHLIMGLALFGKPGDRQRIAGGLAGGLIPDLSLYLMAGTHLLILKTPPRVVFGQMYFSEDWQRVFRIDNSFVLWGIGLALAMSLKSRWATAMCGAALMHLFFDFTLHNNDARAHFWPITTWVFQSPLSYWDPRHFGRIVGWVEVGICLLLATWLWQRYRSVAMRGLIVGLTAVETLPHIIFGFMFAAG